MHSAGMAPASRTEELDVPALRVRRCVVVSHDQRSEPEDDIVDFRVVGFAFCREQCLYSRRVAVLAAVLRFGKAIGRCALRADGDAVVALR